MIRTVSFLGSFESAMANKMKSRPSGTKRHRVSQTASRLSIINLVRRANHNPAPAIFRRTNSPTGAG